MPELPEVETIVRDLEKKLRHKKITGLESLDIKVFQLTPGQVKKIIGKKIKEVRRRAKMIIIDLGDDFLVIHLKMTGQLVLKTRSGLIAGGHPIINAGNELPNKFTRVIFKFSGANALFFNDVRRFGWIRLISKDDFLKLDKSFGAEPLAPGFTLEYFKRALSGKKKTSIKQALLEQGLIAGIGNIYADEALFLAGLRPFRRVKSLKSKEMEKLWRVIPGLLKKAIKYRGTSFSDYVDALGRRGNFIKFLRVYGRAGEKCFRCGGAVEKMKLGGRSTHWCGRCQK